MSSQSFDATDNAPYGFVDDGDLVEEPDQRLEDEILLQDDYREADRFGTTPEEARDGERVDFHLMQERGDGPRPAEETTVGPTSAVLMGDRGMTAFEAGADPTAGPEQAAMHTVTEDQLLIEPADGEDVPAEAVEDAYYGTEFSGR
ncbi:hypothetical protein AB0I28_23100 [Phytomonospora sp. NPDC050363]|uniref:hypothetical protein n=1 Tax=Phytomonospora sp. NPDC050363 TaxID=3155642 RepID=UPI0034032FE2